MAARQPEARAAVVIARLSAVMRSTKRKCASHPPPRSSWIFCQSPLMKMKAFLLGSCMGWWGAHRLT